MSRCPTLRRGGEHTCRSFRIRPGSRRRPIGCARCFRHRRRNTIAAPSDEIYAEAGVPFLWHVDPRPQMLEVFELRGRPMVAVRRRPRRQRGAYGTVRRDRFCIEPAVATRQVPVRRPSHETPRVPPRVCDPQDQRRHGHRFWCVRAIVTSAPSRNSAAMPATPCPAASSIDRPSPILSMLFRELATATELRADAAAVATSASLGSRRKAFRSGIASTRCASTIRARMVIAGGRALSAPTPHF